VVTVTSDLHGLGAEDVLAIQAVIMKYGFLIDDREFDRLGEVFTEDAVVDYRPGGEGPFAGLAEIRRAMKTLQHPVQHMMVSHIIDNVSGDEVVTRTKALIPLQVGGIADITYRDLLVRTPAGWRIKDKSTRSYR
jgi:ketosteroid isomerase-like protein